MMIIIKIITKMKMYYKGNINNKPECKFTPRQQSQFQQDLPNHVFKFKPLGFDISHWVQSYLLNFYYVHRVKICPLNLNFSSDFDRTNWVEFSPQDFPLSTGSYSATAIIHKVFEIGSSFQGKQRTMGNVQFLFFSKFLLALSKFSFQGDGQALSNNSIKI